jgi:hypothetical protein
MADEKAEWTTFEAHVSGTTGRPFVTMTCGVGDDISWQTKMPPSVCTALGLRALQAAIESERDAGFVAYVTGEVYKGRPDAPAAAGLLLQGLRNHREQFDADAGSMRPLAPDDPSSIGDAKPDA